MTDPQSDSSASSLPEESRGVRLDSWKEIAAYLKRDVATVRRWEKREALPVHRHLHEKLGSVFAYTTELDTWSDSRRQKTASGSEESVDSAVSVADPFRQRVLPWLIAGTCALGLALVVLAWAPWRPQVPSTPLRLTVELGAGVSLANVQFGEAAVLSPDGSLVAFAGETGVGERQLYLRRFDRLDATPLSGTDGALSPFFSPDGRWIGFFAGGKLKRVAVTGGAPVPLADLQSARGGAWGEDDTIVFSPHQTAGTHLVRVPSAGGTPEPLTTLAEGEVIHLFPQVLPGGKAVLYTSSDVIGAYNNANLVVQSLSGGERKVVYTGGYYARYLTSGHLVFMHDGTLFAAPFDLDRLEITGQPVPAIEGVASNSQTGAAQFSAAANGTIVYLPGQDAGAGTSLWWMDQAGKATALLPAAGNWINPNFSPDGERLALEMRDEATHISVYDRGRNTLTPLASDTGSDQKPVWAPDGRWLAFAGSSGGTVANVYAQRVDGIGKPVRLTESPHLQQPSSWHPSGKFIAFEETNPHTGRDVMILPIEGDSVSGWRAGAATTFVNGPGPEFDPMFSPDGRWLAYVAAESGNAVYVQPFPGPGGHWLVGAGVNPTWSRSKSELFYGVNGQIMVTTYAVDGVSFHAGKARLWSEARYQTRGIRRMFDLHPDGERFALAPDVPASNGNPDTITMILNFSDELRRLTTTP